MKEIFVFFVIFLFVLSTIAIAEDDNEASDDSSDSNRERTQVSEEAKKKMLEEYNLRRKATQDVKQARLELVKARAGKVKTSIKQIKKIIARILTINNLETKELNKK